MGHKQIRLGVAVSWGMLCVCLLTCDCLAGSGLKLNAVRQPGLERDISKVNFVDNGESIVYVRDRVLYSMPMSTGIAQAISSGYIYDYALSSDASMLVYALGSHNHDQDMYSVSFDTGVQTDLNLSFLNYDPNREVLVPDGSALVYRGGSYSEGYKLLLKSTTGGEARVLVENDDDFLYLTDIKVSSDSSQVLYSNYFGRTGVIKSMPIAGGTASAFPPTDGRLLHATMMPDDAFMIDNVLNIYALDGSFTTWKPAHVDFLGLDSISPDRTRIVFTTDRAYDANTNRWRPRNVYSAAFDGSEPGIEIFPNGLNDEFTSIYSITPDSRFIIVGGDPESTGTSDLYLTPLSGGPLVQLNAPLETGTEAVFAGFTDDGQMVYTAQALGDTHQQLYRTPLTGGVTNVIPTPGFTLQPNATLTPDNQIVLFIGTDSEGEHNLYAVASSGGPVVPMSVPFNDDYISTPLSDVQFSPDGSRCIFMVFSASYRYYQEYNIAGIPLSIIDTGSGITGHIAGGAGFIGGIDYHFDTVTTGGVMKAVYESGLFSETDPEIIDHIDFLLTGDTLQYWDTSMDGEFTGLVTLTFTYDENLLGPDVDEALLAIQHQLPDGSFELLPVADRDLINNTVTVTTDSFSNFVLGVVPEPGSVVLLSGLCLILTSRRTEF